jgi:hypothetical protein
MVDPGEGQPVLGEALHPGISRPASLATSRQGALPQPLDMPPEALEPPDVERHPIVPVVPPQDGLEPEALPRFFLPVGAEVRDRDDALSGLHQLRDARRVLLTREEVGG